MSLESDSESSPTLEDGEYALVRSVATRIRTTERDDLESVLAIHLLQLKARFGKTASDWRAFLGTALRNKASNWIRDRQLAESRHRPLDIGRGEDEPEQPIAHSHAARDPPLEFNAAIRAARAELDERLRDFWDTLLELDGNQAKVARRFGIHRNTVRLWIRRIRASLERHGLEMPP